MTASRTKRPWPPVQDPELLRDIERIPDELEIQQARRNVDQFLGAPMSLTEAQLKAALHPPDRAAILFNAISVLEERGLLESTYGPEHATFLHRMQRIAGRYLAQVVLSDTFRSRAAGQDTAAERQDVNRVRDKLVAQHYDQTSGTALARASYTRKRLQAEARQALPALRERLLGEGVRTEDLGKMIAADPLQAAAKLGAERIRKIARRMAL